MVLSSILSVILILASPIIVVGNLLILSAWFRFKRLRTPSNSLIVSLATADLGFGLFLPVAVGVEWSLPDDKENDSCDLIGCIGPFAILLTFCAASLLSVAAIALDRFTSVAQPLRYNHFVTASYVQRFVLACWIYAVTIGLIPFIFVKETGVEVVIAWLSVFLYGPCLVSAILSYGYIYVVARSHARAIYSVEISLNNGGICEITDTSVHHHRYGVTLALILGSILLCWIPIQVCALVDFFAGTKILMDHQSRVLTATPIVLSSLVNPWLYGYRSSEIRLAVLRLIDSLLTKITGRPPTMNIFYQQQNKGDMTSCASNVRLLAISPTQTTVQCCSTNGEGKKQHHLHLMICDQVSTTL